MKEFRQSNVFNLLNALNLLILVSGSSFLFIQTSCGTNQLVNKAPSSPPEEAQLLLEKGEFLAAREKLEPYLVNYPTDYKAKALLAATYAREAGISIIDLTEETLSSEDTSNSDLISGIVPETSEANFSAVKTARTLILEIPSEFRVQDIAFGETVYVLVYTLMLVKRLTESTSLPTLEDAIEIIGSLDEAVALAEKNNLPTQQIEKVRSEIANEPGASEQEKLASYLSKIKAKNSATPPSLTE